MASLLFFFSTQVKKYDICNLGKQFFIKEILIKKTMLTKEKNNIFKF